MEMFVAFEESEDQFDERQEGCLCSTKVLVAVEKSKDKINDLQGRSLSDTKSLVVVVEE
jgi:hypothetical protein